MTTNDHFYRQRYAQLKFFFRKLPGMIACVDARGRYLDFNDDFFKLAENRDKRPKLGAKSIDFFSEQNAKIIDANNLATIKLGSATAFEEVFVFPDKPPACWLSLNKPIYDHDGIVRMLLSFRINITSRKRLEEQLGLNIFTNKSAALNYVHDRSGYISECTKLLPSIWFNGKNAASTMLDVVARLDLTNEADTKIATELYEIALFNFPGNVFWMDDALRIQFINQNLLNEIGFSHQSMVMGKTLESFLSDDVSAAFTEINTKVMHDDVTHVNEEHIHIKGKDKVYFSMKRGATNPITQKRNLIGTSIDFTLQKDLERNFRKALNKQGDDDKAKEAFIANISHDIRTPITGMIQLIEDIKERSDEVPNIDFKLRELENLTQEFLQLFDGILKSAEENEAALSPQNKSDFNLVDIINRCLTLFKPTLMYQDVELIFIKTKQLPERYYANPMIIKRILINLIGNAVKFTESGEIKVIAHFNKRKKVLTLTVTDTGIGISEHAHQKIFERFTRLDSSANSAHSGSGLGLYMVKKYVDSMGGTIALRSDLGKGSSFTINLPISPSEIQVGQYMIPISPRYARVVLSNGDLDALVVEDNRLAALAFKKILESFGFEVTVAETGHKAITYCQKKTYGLVFLDLGLPDQSGLTVLAVLRQMELYQKIPIYMLTGHITEAIVKQCLDAGADGAYTKPMMPDELGKLLEDIQA